MALAATPRFGDVLKEWRVRRRISQLDLSAEAGVSQRHLSFLETGRSHPSREMVVHLAAALDVPLRDRNAGLAAAGFAALYTEHGLEEPDLEHLRHVLGLLLEAHAPFPAYVVDRGWNIVLANRPATAMTAMLVDPSLAPTFGGNVLRLSLHPDGIRNSVVNWDGFASELMRRLDREMRHRPGDEALTELLEELQTYPGVPELASRRGTMGGRELLVPLHIRTHELDLRLFTTIATIGAAHDVTLEELRIETLLPADPDTEASLRTIARDP